LTDKIKKIKELEEICLDIMRHNTNDSAIKIEISINKTNQRAKIKLYRTSRFYERGHEKTMTISEDLN